MAQALRVLFWNVENLFITPWSSKNYQKPPEQLLKIKHTIEKIDPHIICLTEVGGEVSLRSFNKEFLNDGYIVSLIPGNSDRGIEIGYLIKKDLPYRYEHLTHRNRTLNLSYPHRKKERSYFMSRDIAELRVFPKQSPPDAAPSLIILGVHLKSALDSEGLDPGGKKRRGAECELLVKTYQGLKKKFSNELPIIIGGDFNGEAHVGKHAKGEFKELGKVKDLAEIFNPNDPIEKRYTYFGLNQQRTLTYLQLDNILFSSSLSQHLEVNDTGRPRLWRDSETMIPLPLKNADRYTHPSDHYPLLISFFL